MNRAGIYDTRTKHAGCPVLLGEKWGKIYAFVFQEEECDIFCMFKNQCIIWLLLFQLPTNGFVILGRHSIVHVGYPSSRWTTRALPDLSQAEALCVIQNRCVKSYRTQPLFLNLLVFHFTYCICIMCVCVLCVCVCVCVCVLLPCFIYTYVL